MMDRSHFFLFTLLFLSLQAQGFSNPQGASVISGEAVIEQNLGQLQVTASDRAIIHWDDFSIADQEVTKFVQPDSGSWVLNRVVGENPSEILGTLEANGHVFLLNPQGLLISENAVIDTAGFTASTFELADQEFLQKDALHFKGSSQEAIVNFGTINAWDGDIVLIARTINNAGNLLSAKGAVALGAGVEVLLKPAGTERLFIQAASDKNGVKIEQAGVIAAIQTELKADGNPYSFAIQHAGSISDAMSVIQKEGRVLLSAESGSASVEGSISLKTGEIALHAENDLVIGDGANLELQQGSLFLTATSGEISVAGSLSAESQGTIHMRAPEVALQETARLYSTGDSQSIVFLESTARDVLVYGGIKAYEENRILINSAQDIKLGNGSQSVNSRIDTVSGTIKISAARDLYITASKNKVAQITSQSPSANISIDAGRDAFVTGGTDVSGRAIVFSKGDLSFVTGRHLMMKSNGDGYAGVGATNLATITVDHLFSTPPIFGPGALFMGQNTRMQGGTLRIYTAKQSLNTIEGVLNLVPYYPGMEYAETAEEVWGSYFSSSSSAGGGVPFTIYYKDIFVHPAVTDLFNIATSEFLQNLRDYDNFYYMPKTFCVRYMRKWQERDRVKGSLFTPNVMPNRCYKILREDFRYSNGKMVNLL